MKLIPHDETMMSYLSTRCKAACEINAVGRLEGLHESPSMH